MDIKYFSLIYAKFHPQFSQFYWFSGGLWKRKAWEENTKQTEAQPVFRKKLITRLCTSLKTSLNVIWKTFDKYWCLLIVHTMRVSWRIDALVVALTVYFDFSSARDPNSTVHSSVNMFSTILIRCSNIKCEICWTRSGVEKGDGGVILSIIVDIIVARQRASARFSAGILDIK